MGSRVLSKNANIFKNLGKSELKNHKEIDSKEWDIEITSTSFYRVHGYALYLVQLINLVRGGTFDEGKKEIQNFEA